jgi:molybdopterin-guanine dinucleotide biosynthesis protein MobB
VGRAEAPLILAIVGKKNSGKTTLLVGVAAELRRRGVRVASVKHGHHDFEIDRPGRDSWRHVHEGGVEAVLILAAGRVAMVMETPDEEPDALALIERHLGGRGYDVVLVEGFKQGDLPKIEIYRRAAGQTPVYDARDAAAARRFLAIVTDETPLSTACPSIPLAEDGSHVIRVADLITALLANAG